MGTMASQITSLTTVYSTVYSGRDKKKTSKLRVTGLCVGKSPMTGEFPAQRASNAENVSIWWRHHEESTVVCYIVCMNYVNEAFVPKINCIFRTMSPLSVGGLLPNYDWHGSRFHVALPPWTPVWNGFSVKPMPQHSFWPGSYSKPNQ